MSQLYECQVRTDQGQVIANFSGESGDPSPLGGTIGEMDFDTWHAQSPWACERLTMVCNLQGCDPTTVLPRITSQYSSSVTIVCGRILVDCDGNCASFTSC